MIKHTLKNGTSLFYNPDKHVYMVNNVIVPSVTGICGKGVPKPQLINWMVYTPLNEFKKLIKEKLDNNLPIDNVELERIKKSASSKTTTVKEDAGMVGTVVHDLIERHLKGLSIAEQSDPKVVNCWNLFVKWWEKSGYEVVELEKKIYSSKWDYAGTLDLIVKDEKGSLVLIDIKTSNSISFDYYLQLNAYKVAYEEETKQKIRKALIVRLPKKDSEIEFRDIPLTKDLFKAFIGAKTIWQEMKKLNGSL